MYDFYKGDNLSNKTDQIYSLNKYESLRTRTVLAIFSSELWIFQT